MKLKFCLLLLIVFCVNVDARYWDGGGDGTNWHDAANWQGDIKPASDENAQFGVTSYNNAVLMSTETANQLWMGYGGTYASSLEFVSGANLTVIQTILNKNAYLNITAGSLINNGEFYLGIENTNAVVDVNTAGQINAANVMYIGTKGGDGTMNILGGSVSTPSNIYMGYGYNGSPSRGDINIIDGTLSAAGIYIGFDTVGAGSVIQDGGLVDIDALEVGHNSAGNPAIYELNAGTLDISGNLLMGVNGSSDCKMEINGGQVNLGSEFHIGYAGTGANAVLDVNLPRGQSLFFQDKPFYIGTYADATGVMNITDEGKLTILGNIGVGYHGTGTLNIESVPNPEDANELYLEYIIPGWQVGSEGTVNINRDLQCTSLLIGVDGDGLININDGVVQAYSVYIPNPGGTGTGHLQFDGGVIITAVFKMREDGLGTGTLDFGGGTSGGVLIIARDKTADIASYIANGWITASDGGTVVYDYNTTYEGYTTVRSSLAVPPNLCFDYSEGDLDKDCDVDMDDLADFVFNWLECGIPGGC